MSYTTIKKLGEGAFGETFLAEKEGKQVVIKQLKLNSVDHWEAIDRFRREANILKQLNHPGIPDYIDFIETEKSAGIVQEYVDGRSLEELIGQRKIDQKLLESIIQQGFEILKYLQSFTTPIIHRDISPKNFLLDQNNKLYLIDFGGVQKSYAYGSDDVTCMGTFGYMAPEQIMGQATPQSDLYSFGMVLLNLVSGKKLEDLPVEPKTGKLKLSKLLKKQPKYIRKLIIEMIQPGISQRLQTPARGLEMLQEVEDQPLKNILMTPMKEDQFELYILPKKYNLSIGRYTLGTAPPLLRTLQKDKNHPFKSLATPIVWMIIYFIVLAGPLFLILMFASPLPEIFTMPEMLFLTFIPFFIYLLPALATGAHLTPSHFYHHHYLKFTPEGFYYSPEINYAYEEHFDNFPNKFHHYKNLTIHYNEFSKTLLIRIELPNSRNPEYPFHQTIKYAQFKEKKEAVACYLNLRNQISQYSGTEDVFKMIYF